MEDEEISTEETVIEPARTEPAIEERILARLDTLTEQIQSLADRMNLIESDASHDDRSGNADGTEQPAPLSSVSEPIDNPEAETPYESGDGSGTVKQPRRQHPYYRKRWG